MLTWLLSKVSGWLLPAAGVAFGLAAIFGTAQTYRLKTAKAETAQVKQAWQLDRAQAVALALQAATAYRAKEQAWQLAQKEASDEAERQLTQARADAAIADAAAGRLQQRVAALIVQARAAAANPVAAASSTPVADPIGMLANVLSRLDKAAGQFAQNADESRAAGEACERSYDALTK